MFERLINAGHPSLLLDVQYRMHPAILALSNQLFYDNKITSGYKFEDRNTFLDKEKPLLIVNVKGTEKRLGTSTYNEQEAETVCNLLHFLTTNHQYAKEKFWVITPYFAQQVQLDSKLALNNMANQIVTIDASQGRETDFVIVSMVRSNRNNSIGFLGNDKRINVALTRA